MATFVNQNKSNTSPIWKKYTRRGTTPNISDLGDFIFTDPISEDGDPTLGNATIASFDSSSVTWSNSTNKSSSPTWTNTPKT